MNLSNSEKLSFGTGYSKKSESERLAILVDRVKHFGIDAVFAKFSQLARYQFNGAYAEQWKHDLDVLMRTLPTKPCPPGEIFSAFMNKCVKDVAKNRNSILMLNQRIYNVQPLSLSNSAKRKEREDEEEEEEEEFRPKKSKFDIITIDSDSDIDVSEDEDDTEPVSTLLKVWNPRSVMLAETFKGNVSKLQFPLMVSTKYDGNRIIRAKDDVLTRGLLILPNKEIRDCIRNLMPEGADMEIVIDSLNETGSWVKGQGLPSDSVVHIYFFDWVSLDQPSQPLRERVARIERWAKDTLPLLLRIHNICSKHLKIHTGMHKLVYTGPELQRMYDDAVANNAEGLILRNPDSIYEERRSGTFLKWKRENDAEAMIVGFNQAEDGYLKSFQVKYKNHNFKLSSGLNAKTRKLYWAQRKALLGAMVKFSYQDIGSDTHAPRHAKIIGIRSFADMSS